MAVAARKIEHAAESRRARLKAVPAQRASRKAPARKKCSSAAVARQNFRMFAVLVIVFAVLGMGRVWLSVQAAEASLEANRLRHDIKAERYIGDMLEVQQSALGSPSRIRAIAGATMDMTAAGEVTYIDLPVPEVARAEAPSANGSAMHKVLEDALDLAAGEAQVLLVGDVGLASAR